MGSVSHGSDWNHHVIQLCHESELYIGHANTKFNEQCFASVQSALTVSTQESLLVEKLKVELKQMELEKSQLEEKLKTIEDASNTEEEEDKSSSLSEERLRWQMEKENLRKELMAKMDAEREPILKEKEALENKLRLIEEAGQTLSREQITTLEQNLTQSQTRLADSVEYILRC